MKHFTQEHFAPQCLWFSLSCMSTEDYGTLHNLLKKYYSEPVEQFEKMMNTKLVDGQMVDMEGNIYDTPKEPIV